MLHYCATRPSVKSGGRSVLEYLKLSEGLIMRDTPNTFLSKVVLKGFIIVPEADLDAVKQELINHKRLTLEEQGCLVFDVVENSDNPLRFDVYEEFLDKASFEYHQQRVKASYWGEVTRNVERYYEIVE